MNDLLLNELKNTSILCVEDEDGIRQMIVKTLKYYFKDVYEASNGEDAYDLYIEYKPKIILSDINMNKGNGIDFVKKVRKNDLDTMIIMLTAYSNEEYLMDLINLNINHYILKPLNLSKLDSALDKYVNNKIDKKVILCENLVLDVQKRELLYNERDHISLRKREKDFLCMLFDNKNQITRYEQIEHELWSEKSMTSHALKSFIKEIRLKIPLNIIKNVPQEGYILNCE